MPFEFEKTELYGVILVKPIVFGDNRGFFLETYKKTDLCSAGLNEDCIQNRH